MITRRRFLLDTSVGFAMALLPLGGAGVIRAWTPKTMALDDLMLDAWETGVHYHLLHSVALLGVAGWLRGEQRAAALRRAAWAVWCWCAGIALFSGSLYLLAAGGPGWLGPVTPIGGVALVAGWLWLGASAWAL